VTKSILVELSFPSSHLLSPLGPVTLSHRSMYNLLINLILHQLIPFLLGSVLIKFPWSNAFCQSIQQAHNSSTMSEVHSDIIPSIPILVSSSKYVFVMYKKINQLTTTVTDMITELCKSNSCQTMHSTMNMLTKYLKLYLQSCFC
jgi:hypothetical protein